MSTHSKEIAERIAQEITDECYHAGHGYESAPFFDAVKAAALRDRIDVIRGYAEELTKEQTVTEIRNRLSDVLCIIAEELEYLRKQAEAASNG